MYVCIYIYVYTYIYIDIYIYGTPPRPTFQANLVAFTMFFLTFWTLKLRAFFGDQSLQLFVSLFPSHPSLSTSDSRFEIQDLKKKSWIQGVGFKIQDPKKTSWTQRPSALKLESWIQRGWIEEVFSEPWNLNLESKEVGLKKFFLSLETWILNPKRLDWRSFFWAFNLESWILNPKRLDWRSFFWAFNLESWI